MKEIILQFSHFIFKMLLALYLIAITSDLQLWAETHILLIYSFYSLYSTPYFNCCDNPEVSRILIQENFEFSSKVCPWNLCISLIPKMALNLSCCRIPNE